MAVAIEGRDEDGVDSFAAVYQQVHPALLAHCRRLLGPGGDAEGLAQEALLRGWQSWDPSSGRPFWPWALTVARNLAIDHHRRESRRAARAPAIALAAAGERFPQPEDALVRDVEHTAVRQAFDVIPPPYQTMLNQHHVEGRSYQEIADLHGVSTEVVRGRLRRARHALRAAYLRLENAVPVVMVLPAGLRRMRNGVVHLGGRIQARLAANGSLQIPAEAIKSAVVLALVLSAGPGWTSKATPRSFGSAPESAAGAPAPSSTLPVDRSASHHDMTGPGGHSQVPPVPPSLGLPIPNGDASTPEQAWFTGLTASPDAGHDSTVFAVGEAFDNCPTVSCPVLFRSTDLGASWSRLPATGFGGGTLMLPPAWPQDPRLFVLGPDALSESTDDGATFVARTPAGRTGAMSPGFSRGDRQIWVGFVPGWVYHDDSKVVTPLDMWPPSTADYATYAFSPAWPADRRVLVGGWSPGGDGVQTATVSLCRATTCSMPTVLPGVYSSPELLASPSFERTGVAYAWAGDRFFRTSDAGRHFSPLRLPGPGKVSALVPAGDRLYLAMADAPATGPVGGVFVSDDLGTSWRRLGGAHAFSGGATAVVPLPHGRILAAPQILSGGGLLCSTDGGDSWERRCN